MSQQPLTNEVLAKGLHYIFVCKPGDHQYLFEWLNDYPELPSLEMIDKKVALINIVGKIKSLYMVRLMPFW